MDVIALLEMAKVASTDASLIVGAAGFILTLSAAVAAGIGLWGAASENYRTQIAKRKSEEEQHVLSLVKLAANYNESRDLNTQLAGIAMLAHHPEYLDVLREMRDVWQTAADTDIKNGVLTTTWPRLANMANRAIERAEVRRVSSRWWLARWLSPRRSPR